MAQLRSTLPASAAPRLATLSLLAGALGCGGSPAVERCGANAACTAPLEISMDFAASGSFYAAPFPTDARPGAAGLDGFPNPSNNDLVARIRRGELKEV